MLRICLFRRKFGFLTNVVEPGFRESLSVKSKCNLEFILDTTDSNSDNIFLKTAWSASFVTRVNLAGSFALEFPGGHGEPLMSS